jgi:hypothetical protein
LSGAQQEKREFAAVRTDSPSVPIHYLPLSSQRQPRATSGHAHRADISGDPCTTLEQANYLRVEFVDDEAQLRDLFVH